MNINQKKIWESFTDAFQETIIHPQYHTFIATKKGIKAVKKYASGTLVDLGCGRMPYRPEIEPLVKKYIAIDNPQTASMYHGKWKPDIYADAKKIPLKNASVDTVIFLQVLEYIDDPNLAFKEIARILKRNGKLILSVPFMYAIHDIPFDLARYTEPMLRKMLIKNGFSIISFKAEGTFADFWGQALNVFLMKRIKDILRSKKDSLTFVLLLMLILISVPLIFLSNVVVLFLDFVSTFLPKYTNYFPLDYVVVAKKRP